LGLKGLVVVVVVVPSLARSMGNYYLQFKGNKIGTRGISIRCCITSYFVATALVLNCSALFL
jgi:hypothetical protein